MTPDDTFLVERLRKGDLEAFDLIYKKYSGKLYSFGFKYLKSKAEAEELVQSVFLKLWEHHKKLDSGLSFKSYMFTIAYNDICKLFRKRSYLQQYVRETLNSNEEGSSDTEEGIDYQSALEEVQDLIGRLPEKQKAVFVKSRIDGKSTKEIAAEMRLSPGTVDNYISEAIKSIRRQIKRRDLPAMLLFFLFLA